MSRTALAQFDAGLEPERAHVEPPGIAEAPVRIRVLGPAAEAIGTQLAQAPAAAGIVLLPPPPAGEAESAFDDVDLVLVTLDASDDARQQLRSLRLALPDVTLLALPARADPPLARDLTALGVDACFEHELAEGPAFAHLLVQIHRVARLRAHSAARDRELEERERRFQNLVAASADGLLVLDPDGVIGFANPAAATMFGRSAEGLIGSELGYPVSGASTTEIEILGPDGAFGVAEMRVEPHRWQGRPALLALLRDVTRFKETEARLRATTQEVEARNRELEDFAVIVSHDLQEPLRKIRLFGRRLADRSEAALDQDGKVSLGHMLSAADRMRGLLMDLLDLTRVSASAPSFVEVDLASLAAEAVHDLAAALEESRGRIEWHDLPLLRGEPAQLRLVLQNLFANALKYRRPDVPPRVRVENVEGAPGTRAFAVLDNGIGFEQMHAERIFAPFQRLHPAHVYSGTGIGLAICRKIVERHHGRIEAFGEPGCGARFVITLPLQPEGVL